MKVTYYGIIHTTCGFYSSGMYEDKFSLKKLIHSLFRIFFSEHLNLPKDSIICFTNYSHGYFHWITESLPYILTLPSEECGAIYLPINHKGFQSEILKSFGFKVVFFKKNQVLKASSFKSISLTKYRQFNLKSILSLQSRIKILSNRKELNPNKKIFVVRKASMRNLINQSAIASLLRENEWFVFDPSTANFTNQFQVFSQATSVISIHGAALANILWCSPETKIIELVHSHMPQTVYSELCKSLNLNYFRIEGDSILRDENTHPDRNDLFVSLDKIKEFL